MDEDPNPDKNSQTNTGESLQAHIAVSEATGIAGNSRNDIMDVVTLQTSRGTSALTTGVTKNLGPTVTY